MQQRLDAMQTALRVLVALTEKRQPDPADVDALRRYSAPQPEEFELDEFACDVIQKALKRRVEIRVTTHRLRLVPRHIHQREE